MVPVLQRSICFPEAEHDNIKQTGGGNNENTQRRKGR